MEHLVLEVLRFECSPSTAYYFATLFSKLSGVPGKAHTSYVKVQNLYFVCLNNLKNFQTQVMRNFSHSTWSS